MTAQTQVRHEEQPRSLGAKPHKTPAHRPGDRRAFVVALLAIVLAGGLLVTQRSAVVTASEAADAAVAREHVTSARLAATEYALSAVQQHLEATVVSAADASADTSTAVSTRLQLLAQLEASTIQINAVRTELVALGQTNANQNANLAGLETCLQGIRAASVAGSADDRSTGVNALQTVQAVCAQTFRALGVGGSSSFVFDFADPFVLRHEGSYYGYATNSGAGRVQLITSPDLDNWSLVGDVLTGLPDWAIDNYTWAPSVAKVGDKWLLYYTVRERASGLQCISSAVATTPSGPFIDGSTEPLVCQRSLGGSIDPSPFIDDDGHLFLLFKSDAVVRGQAASLWSVPLTPDGRGLGWFPIELAKADRAWENRVVEAPSMFEEDGVFFVLYSGNHWGTPAYATGYLSCTTPIGPCTKPPNNVILGSHGSQKGPGGAEVFERSGQRWVSYHAWEGEDVGYPNKRRLHTARLTVNTDGRPRIG